MVTATERVAMKIEEAVQLVYVVPDGGTTLPPLVDGGMQEHRLGRNGVACFMEVIYGGDHCTARHPEAPRMPQLVGFTRIH